jgi:uncharacterized membrane protein
MWSSRTLITLAVSALILLILDGGYLYVFSKLFNTTILDIQHTPFNVPQYKYISVFICYLLIITALNFFILQDSDKTPFDAFLLGIFIYGIYETTNYSIFTKWPLSLAIIDTLWGGILFALTTYFIGISVPQIMKM